jgi:tetratricopeptide (TPR) repeat protein
MTHPSSRKKKKMTISASSEGVKRAENALIGLGFDSKSDFAKSKFLARTTVTKFFQCESIQLDSFKKICQELELDWRKIAGISEEKPSQIPGITDCINPDINEGGEKMLTPTFYRQVTVIDKKANTLKAEMKLIGDIKSLEDLSSVELNLREVSGDTIKIIDIKEGSIRLTVEGSQEDIDRLVSRIKSGELKEVSGFPVADVQILSESSEDDESNELNNKWHLVREIVTQGFRHRNLSGVDLSDADLSGANLNVANLSDADLSDADLSGADLSGADLSGADLRSAVLRSADLSRADLSGADLSRADLRSADLRSADLRSADLSRAVLEALNWDSDTKWVNAKGLHEAVGVPSDLAQQPAFAAAVLVSQGISWRKEGKVEEAFNAYNQALSLDSSLEKSAEFCNSFCWFGSLDGYAVDVLYLCENAVTLKPDNKNYQDSRGLAKALTDDLPGALEDFQAAVNSNALNYSQDVKQRRQRWIQALKAGQNPFTPEELEALRQAEG